MDDGLRGADEFGSRNGGEFGKGGKRKDGLRWEDHLTGREEAARNAVLWLWRTLDDRGAIVQARRRKSRNPFCRHDLRAFRIFNGLLGGRRLRPYRVAWFQCMRE